jgi:hypothetical protein
MKNILILTLSIIFTNIALLGQKSISPNVNTEFCPLVNQTFTVTIPLIKSGTNVTLSVIGSPTIVTGVTGLTSSVSNTTFTFVGRFSDDNNTQSFKVDYIKSNNTADNYIVEFKKIKSLKFISSPSAINTNIQSISSEICKITTHNINFTNIKFGNAFDGTVPAYGNAITQYEYLLPSNWKLNTTTSTGNWILANIAVTITSDLTSGNGGSIQIRALNTDCGITLAKSPPKVIPITRPEPPLAISGATQLCFPNSYTYILTGVPSGAVVTWQPNSYYSISGSGNSISVAPTSFANGATNVTASVYLPICGLTFTKSFAISIGVPTVTFSINGYPYPEPNCYEVFGIYTFQAQQVTGYPNTYSGFDWGWRNLTNNTISNDQTIYGSQYTFFPYDAGTYEIWVKPTNGCGPGSYESLKTVTVVESCSGLFRLQSTALTVYPNPTKGQATIVIPTEYRKTGILQVANQFGIVVLTRKIPTDAQTFQIDISKFGNGIYQLTLKSNKNSLQTKLIKQ